MSEAELLLVNNADGCTIYTIQFLSENESEYERFYTRFKDDAEYNPDLMRIVALINKIADMGALERYFRPEGKLKDGVCALPVLQSKLRLYCLRLSDKILVLGNGGVKKTRTYNEDDTLIRICAYFTELRETDKRGRKGRHNFHNSQYYRN